jgi:anti-sigma B factor antagonist
LDLETRKTGSIALVALRGKVTLGDASLTLRRTAEELIAEGFPRIVYNLSGVTFIDSAGLGTLTLGYSKAKAAGGLLKLVAPQKRIREALEMTRLTVMFPLYESDEEAINSFAEPGAGGKAAT